MDAHFLWSALLVLGVFFNLGQLSFTLEIRLDPPSIVAGLTPNTTIKCITNDVFSDDLEYWWLRLTRQTQNGWEIMYEANILGADVITSPDNLHFNQDMGRPGLKSSIEITWDLTVNDTYGMYRCQAWLNKNRTEMDVRVSENMVLKENITLNLITNIWHGLANDPSECISSDANSTKKTYLEIRKDELTRQLELYLRNTLWFKGNYALLMTDTGCPVSFDHFPSMLKFHEESSTKNTCITTAGPNHLSKPVRERMGENCFLYLRFCEVKGDEVERTEWPNGKYCINRINKKDCPPGFLTAALEQIDLEDTDTNVVYEGNVTWGNQAFSFIEFCCKDSGPVETPAEIPTASPFYLYRVGGTCQKVLGMYVTEEYFEIDTEIENINNDLTGLLKPDIELEVGEPIRVHVCYYNKKPQNPRM